jgi:hypothetical protein
MTNDSISSLDDTILEAYDNYRCRNLTAPFSYAILEPEEEYELLLAAAQEHIKQDFLNQWEYFERVDMGQFALSLLRGEHYCTNKLVMMRNELVHFFKRDVEEAIAHFLDQEYM